MSKPIEKTREIELQSNQSSAKITVEVPKVATKTGFGQLPRDYGILGISLYLLGFLLGALANTVWVNTALVGIEGYADMLVALGFVLSFYGATRVNLPFRQILVIGIVFAVGVFYKWAEHAIHIASGLGFNMLHTAHILTGLAIIGVATATATIVSYRARAVQLR